jgi:formate hydrogenlyase subunit 3/multisubunit Na+/H+ antiporter MnhD subunit
MSKPNRHLYRIGKLKKALERTAFASLIADICITAITLISLEIGKSYTIGILFIFNYILTIIVAVSLILMAYIAILSHSHRISKIIGLFKFK